MRIFYFDITANLQYPLDNELNTRSNDPSQLRLFLLTSRCIAGPSRFGTCARMPSLRNHRHGSCVVGDRRITLQET